MSKNEYILEVDIRKYPLTNYDQLYSSFRMNIPEYFNIGEAICDRPAAMYGDRVAIYYEDDEGNKDKITYFELKNSSNKLANLLKDLGVSKGDVIGVLLHPRIETAISLISIYKLGCIVLSMSPLFGTEAVKYRLKDSEAKALIVEGYRRDVREMEDEIKTLRHVIVVDGKELKDKEIAFEELKACPTRFKNARTHSNEPAHMFYTSGTTGPPKGVLHAHRFLLGHIPAYQLYFDIAPEENDVFWTVADWGWIGALGDVVLPTLYFGKPVVAYRREGPFIPEKALEIMESYKVTCAFIPPTALRMIRKKIEKLDEDYDLKIRVIASAGESVGADLVIWGREKLKVPINEFYGQTEANLVVVTCSKIMDVKPGAMGKACPGHIVEIIDENGNILPPGKIGEIAVKKPDPVMFICYWKRPDATRAKFIGEWMLTGDLGWKDEEGYIWFKSRKDDLIKSAAYRIGPEEIENVINQHPAVLESAVIAKPDPIRGNIVKAFVVLEEGFEPSEKLKEEIKDLVKKKVAAYAYPREIEFISEIPKTVTGKIKRYELRQREMLKSAYT